MAGRVQLFGSRCTAIRCFCANSRLHAAEREDHALRRLENFPRPATSSRCPTFRACNDGQFRVVATGHDYEPPLANSGLDLLGTDTKSSQPHSPPFGSPLLVPTKTPLTPLPPPHPRYSSSAAFIPPPNRQRSIPYRSAEASTKASSEGKGLGAVMYTDLMGGYGWGVCGG